MTAMASLGEICQFLGGGTPSRKVRQYWNGGIPWATVKDFGTDRISHTAEFISQEGLDNSASKIVPSGTVLLVTRVGLGKVAMAEVDLAINQDIKAIMPCEDMLPEFLLWSLKSIGSEIERKGAGATVKGITLHDVKELKVPIPPLEEQYRLVGILNRASHIERLRARATDRLQQFIPALFLKMFGDPAANPMGWRVAALSDICVSVQYGTSKKANDYTEGIPVLRMGNVTYFGNLDCADLKRVELDDRDFCKYSLRVGDILFNRTNSRDLVGKTGLWDGRFEAVAASYFIRLRVDENVVLPTYVWAFLNTDTMKRHLFAMARGAIGQANINAKELKALSLPLPPLARQREFATLVNSAYRTMEKARTATEGAAVLSASLMDRLLGR